MPAAIPFITLGLGAVGAATTITGARETRRGARRQEREQRRQAELQERISVARTKRLRRIRQAQMLATTGAAGITGAIVEAPTIAAEVGEAAQVGLIGEQTELQKRQYGIQAAQTAAEAEAAIGKAIGTFATTAISPAPGRETGTLIGEVFRGK